MQLIDKAALVAEIHKRLHANGAFDTTFDTAWAEDVGMCNAYKSILSFIDTLEVKEMDLDKLLIDFMSRYAYQNNGEYPSAIDIAKHFFELGFKVNNDVVIEKACEWLKSHVTYIHPRKGTEECVVNLNAFREAMKKE